MNKPAPRFTPKHVSYSLGIALCMTLLTFPAMAQERVIRIARVSLVEGDVNFQRAQDKRDQWFEATANLPLDENDQVYTGANGRSEIQFTGGNLVRLSRDTNLKVTQFNNATMQFALSIGTATFRIGNLDRRKLQTVDASEADNDQPIYFEVDSPVIAITLLREGSYRINVADDGTTELIVRRGAAEIFNKELGTIAVREGRRIIVEGKDSTLYQVRKLDDKDDWDRWNDRRDEELFARAEYRSVRYVPAYIPGVYDLDVYGDWYEAAGYGWVWSPRVVGVGWAPYRTGSWRWYPSYGWTWIGYEPWGWVPYHYGRWAYWSNRWCWVPHVSFGVSFGWSWSPALVAFYGSRGGYGRGYRDGFSDGYRRGAYDWIGWVPLAPGEHHGSVAGRGPVLIERASLLRNYTAPGGVSGVDGKDFDRSRVLVRDVIAEPNRSGAGRSVEMLPVQLDQVKPKDAETPRTVQIPRSSTGRDLSSPVVVRRSPVPATVETNGAVKDTRGAGARPTREAAGASPVKAGEAASGSAVSTPTTIERIERPSRAAEFKPAERPVAPTRSNETRILRDQSVPTEGTSAPRREQTSPAPTRGESRGVEQAAPERIERRAPTRTEEPRRIERQESAPRPSSPPPSPPPSPRPERQAQPSPEKQSQPAPERQSQPAPDRSREGSAPSRPAPTTKKPDSE